MSEHDKRWRTFVSTNGRTLVIAISAILGLVVGGSAFAIIAATPPPSSVIEAGTDAGAAGSSKQGSSTPTTTSTHPDGPGQGKEGGNSGGGQASGGGAASGSGSGSGAVQPPAPAPQPATWCPDSRDQNPSLWDECRAGYVRPSIVYAGAVSCTINNRATGDYTVVLGFRVVGGNYRDYWVGSGVTDSSLTYTTVLHGVQPDWPVSPGDVAQIAIGSMNGLPGPAIDYVDSEPSGMTTVAEACGL